MSAPKVCKFYKQGNCHYGSSCRFLHSDNRSRYSNYEYYDDYEPKINRNINQQYYDEYTHYGNNNRNDEYDENYYSSRRNNKYHYYNNTKYNRENDHYEKNHNNYEKNDYQTKKENGVKNYHKEHEKYVDEKPYYPSRKSRTYKNELNHHDSQYVNDRERYTSNDETEAYSNNYNTLDHFNDNSKQNKDSQKTKLFSVYKKEIQIYQLRVKELLDSNIWPFTCFHLIGFKYPIQPVGNLNFLEISFEELRCDYYITKTLCSDPGPVHKQSVDCLLAIARKQKEDIIAFDESIQDDMWETFEKCEQSTKCLFENTIEVDPNSYWDMCHNNLDMFEANKDLTQSFSFVINKEEDKDAIPLVKIFMQNENYGKANCQAYEDEEFTNYIPIIPPSKKYCK